MEHGLHPPDYKLWEEIGAIKKDKTPTLEERIDTEKKFLDSNKCQLALLEERRNLYLHKENVPAIINFDIKWLKKFIKRGQRNIASLEKKIK